MAKDLNKTAF